MTDYSVTLKVPDYIYNRARRIAEATAQPVEGVLIEQLKTAFETPLPKLPPDEEAELAALKQLSDDALWALAAEQMPRTLQERQRALLQRNERGAITDTERAELDDLILRGDRLMVRKAEAAGILTERGYKVTPQDLATLHE